MRLGGVRAFGLHIQSLPVELDLFSVRRSIEARGALLDRRDNPDQPISRQCAAVLRIWRRKSEEPDHPEIFAPPASRSPRTIDRSENYSAFDLCLLEIA